MKCSDIPDDLFMAAVEATNPGNPGSMPWRTRWEVRATLERILGTGLPENLFLAKARKLGLKGRLEGCTSCTCRGDYHTPRECHANRCCRSPEYDWRTHPGYDASWEADKAAERDPEAFPKMVAAAKALLDPPSAPALMPFDLSSPSRLVYPPGFVPPLSPPAFAMGSLAIP